MLFWDGQPNGVWNMPYAFNFQNHGVYTPDGKSELTPEDVETYNNAVEAAELAEWIKQPDRWQVYITKNKNNGEWQATNFLGRILGHSVKRKSFRTNLSRNMVAVSFRGTNGANYHGRYGADWSQLCRIRKSKWRKGPC